MLKVEAKEIGFCQATDRPAKLELAWDFRAIFLGFGPAHCGPKQNWPKVGSGQFLGIETYVKLF